ncbi:MAG: phosphoribosyltransferase family protein [Myxococcales bacterium]|nr:phosphoribosyltransferase family protein [Myxococcota bacterium]MDW8281403.1 phosphoribosyltransferase family protein [Myxococcales bacterium]
MRLLWAAARAAADLLWPRRCAACDQTLVDEEQGAGAFCAPCAAALEPLDPVRCCPRCALPQPRPGTCCAGSPLSRARAAYCYGGPLRQALFRLKWQDRDDLAGPLGALLAGPLRAMAPRCDLLVPVPLHRQRLAERGYNQAVLLARAARRAAGVALPLRCDLLRRNTPGPPSRGLGRAARLQRAAAASFVARGGVAGRRILLLDDVLTTGATARACAAALRAAGAERVEVLTLCRTLA